MFHESQQIGLYTLIRKLGEGGFGEVWLAENRNQMPSEKVAIKLPRKDQIDLQSVKEEIFNWILSGKHKNILPIIECESFGNQIAIVSEYAPDGSLQNLLKKHGSFAIVDAVEITIGILDGLAHLHNRQIIHRDLKPDNVLFQGRTPRLTDFGISRAMTVGSQSQTVSGTLSYMAPEAFDGKRNAQTDIWAVGVILYQLLTGSLPFPQKEFIELIGALAMKEPAPLPDSIPSNLQTIVKKALARELSNRFQTAGEMIKELNIVLSQLQNSEISPTEDSEKKFSEPAENKDISGKSADKKNVFEKVSDNYLPETKPAYEIPPTKPVFQVPPTDSNNNEEQLTIENKNRNFDYVAARFRETNHPNNINLRQKLDPKIIIGISAAGILILLISVFVYLQSNSNTSGNSANVPAITTNGTIKVGVYGDTSGATSSFGQSTKNGIQLAFEEINAAGGVNGKKLEMIFADDQGAPDKARTVVSKLISQDKVVAVLGEVASTNSLAAAPVAQEAKIPMIAPSATNPRVTEVGDYISRVCFIDPFQGTVMAKFAANTLNAKTAAILGDNSSDYSKGLAQFFEQEFTRLGGKVIIKETYAQRDPDFKAQLTQISYVKPDVIYVPGYYSEVGIIAKQARAFGINQPLLGGDGWDSPDLWKFGGEALKNSYISNHFSTENPAPEIKNFVKSYRAKFNVEPDTLAALAYDSAKMLADALKRAGTTDGAKLKDAINATKNFAGVTGTMTLDGTRNPVKPAVILSLNPAQSKFMFKEVIAP